MRLVYHHGEDRIRAHVQLCWLALLLIRVAENRHELDRIHLVTVATADSRVAQRFALRGATGGVHRVRCAGPGGV